MRSGTRAYATGILTFACLSAIVPTPARAQMTMSGGGRSLGGYGAATITSYYSNGNGYVPSGGRGGVLPLRGGAGVMGTPRATRPIPPTAIGGASMVASTPIGGISSGGGMGMGSRDGPGIGSGPRSGRRAYAPLLPGGGAGMAPMGGSTGSIGGRSPAGPGFGSPFRVPPDFGGGTSAMAMP